MLTDEVREVISKALDCVIKDVTAHYQRLWDMPDEELDRVLREDAELNKLIDAKRVIDAQPQPPQPSWDDAPEWAMWATIATNRAYKPFRFCWVYHASEPLDANSRGWMMKRGSPRIFGDEVDIPLGIDYRTLKQRRPEAT